MSSPTVLNTEAMILGTGEFAFSPGSKTVAEAQANGYIDFGNILAASPKPEQETKEIMGVRRGVRQVVKTAATKSQMAYELRSNEWDVTKLAIALMGTEGAAFTQAALSAATGDTFAFAATAGKAERWYDLLIGGNRVRNITSVTIPMLTEGTDFVVDHRQGRIRFLAAQSADRVPTINGPLISAGDDASLKSITPLDDVIKSGMGRLTLFDRTNSNVLVYEHTDFSCQVSVTDAGNFDGENEAEMTMRVLVTATVGKVWNAE